LHIGNRLVDARHGERRGLGVGDEGGRRFLHRYRRRRDNVPSDGQVTRDRQRSGRQPSRKLLGRAASSRCVPTRPGRRRPWGRVCDGGRRQWRSRRAVVMSLGEQRFSSRIGWLSGAPLHFPPLRRVASAKAKVPLAVYQRPRVLSGSVARETETRGYDGAPGWAVVECWWGKD
jgi:hypothetical protein